MSEKPRNKIQRNIKNLYYLLGRASLAKLSHKVQKQGRKKDVFGYMRFLNFSILCT